jgi:hypothetical protein
LRRFRAPPPELSDGVVEDNEKNVTLLRDVLQATGCSALEAMCTETVTSYAADWRLLR